jgi:hypothetical protein
VKRSLHCDVCDRPIGEAEVGAESPGVVVCRTCSAEEPPPYYDPAHDDAKRHSYHG